MQWAARGGLRACQWLSTSSPRRVVGGMAQARVLAVAHYPGVTHRRGAWLGLWAAAGIIIATGGREALLAKEQRSLEWEAAVKEAAEMGERMEDEVEEAEMVQQLQRHATEGDVATMLLLAAWYNRKQDKDSVRSAQAWQGAAALASSQGYCSEEWLVAMHQEALLHLYEPDQVVGVSYDAQEGREVRHAVALHLLQAAAEAGAKDSQFMMGLLYFTGMVARIDDRLARRWFSLAAEQGQEDAASYLAEMYLYGTLATPKDSKTAAGIVRLCADQGHARCVAVRDSIRQEAVEQV